MGKTFNQSLMMKIKDIVNIEEMQRKVCIVIVLESKKNAWHEAFDMLKHMYPESSECKVVKTALVENIIFIFCIKEQTDRSLDSFSFLTLAKKEAKTISDTLSSELLEPISVGVSRVVNMEKDLELACEDAFLALETGKIFFGFSPYYCYDEQALQRTVMGMCESERTEYCEKIAMLDADMIAAANKLFLNDLNISEAARAAYYHRNSFAYKIRRIYEMTGMDIRKFEDAMIFKIAVMAKAYKGE